MRPVDSREGHPEQGWTEPRPQDSIRQEYRQSGRDAVVVGLFPGDTFETTLVRPPHVGGGLQRSVLLGQGLYYVSSRLDAGPVETVSRGHWPGMVYMGFNLSETPLCGTLNGVRKESHWGDSYTLSPSMVTTTIYYPHCRLRMLNLFILPAVLVGLAEDLDTDNGMRRIESLACDGREPVHHVSRMTSEMVATVERIDDSPFHGGLKKLYLEGKILELIALRLAQLSDIEPPRPGAALTRRQIERLHEARTLITARMAAPPSLRELSREVALSATLLKRGFRQLFGETVFEHLRNLRLEQARGMLAGRDMSVKEVAHAVGYASLSHFARAFGQRFGASPRSWASVRDSH